MYLRKKSNNHSLRICYLKIIEGQVSLSAVFGTLRVCINGLFFEYSDGLERSMFLRAVRESAPKIFLFFLKSDL